MEAKKTRQATHRIYERGPSIVQFAPNSHEFSSAKLAWRDSRCNNSIWHQVYFLMKRLVNIRADHNDTQAFR